MAYVALYRKYRPRRFADMVGQEHITRVLKRQIETGQTAHAYLFCGARGTGKTSAAKILARAMNCLNPMDGEPCGTCAVCAMGDEALSTDILEIDAASNNGVDEIRDLRDKINFAPTVCRYKVYIIDEVHMLSTGAFNALLKTLEEPPAHAKFILATTEAGKIPATILSRCQRFDFKRIPQPLIEGYLKTVLDDLGVQYEERAVAAIAAAAEGGMRDALSILDQCVALGGELRYQGVVETIGTLDQSAMDRLVEDLRDGRVDRALAQVEEAYLAGKDLSLVLRDLMSAFCSRMTTAAEKKQPLEFYLRAIDLLSQGETAMRFSQRPRTALLAAIARIALVSRDDSVDGLVARVARLEDMIHRGWTVSASDQTAEPLWTEKAPSDAPEVPFGDPPVDAPPWDQEPPLPSDLPPWEEKEPARAVQEKKPALREEAKPVSSGQASRPEPSSGKESDRYQRFLELIRSRSVPAYHTLRFGTLMDDRENSVIIEFDKKGHVMAQALRIPSNAKIVEEALKEVYGPEAKISYVDTPEGAGEELPPLVEKAKSAFGADVIITD